jgi:hypothetical protein
MKNFENMKYIKTIPNNLLTLLVLLFSGLFLLQAEIAHTA